MSEEGEGFLSRWSRRKRAVVEGRAAEEAAPPAPLEAKPEALPAEPEDDFDLTSLPPIESLTIESDFKAFLHRKVPLDLRSAVPGALTPPSGISSAPPITPGISTRRMACRASRWNWGGTR
jgi:hypothetical protein